MKMLYICSTEAGAGKTVVALALGQHWQRHGRSVGYFKPLGMGAADKDAALARQVLTLAEPPEVLSPVPVAEAGQDAAARIQAAAEQVSAGKDVVIAEGYGGLDEAAQGCAVAQALSASILVVMKYRRDADLVDRAAAARRAAGFGFLGVVLNSVPASEDFSVRHNIVPAMETRTVRLLGAVPQIRSLLCAPVAGLADALGGRLEAGNRAEGLLVESVMLSAPPFSDARTYMARHANKAVIIAAERPDVQLAALETSTRALVLTGAGAVDPTVRARAADRGVAIIRVDCDVATALERASSAFGCQRLASEAQAAALADLAGQYLDMKTISAALDVAG